jgi:hypothetical protein
VIIYFVPEDCIVTGELHTGFLTGNREGRDQLETPGVNCRIILKQIFKNRMGRGLYLSFLG